MSKLAISSQPTSMRDRILDATERLLGRFGYQKTTMDDVAREAGVAKRTIYMHFTGKEELALSSIDRIVERLIERLEAIASAPQEPAERVKEMLRCRVLFRFDSVRDYHQSLDDLFESLRPAYMARRQQYFNAEAQVFASVLAAAKNARIFELRDPVETAHTLLLATNALLPSSLSVQELGKRSAVEKKVGGIADLLVGGLRSRGSTRD
jgi:AcrR family transcriptional regulator